MDGKMKWVGNGRKDEREMRKERLGNEEKREAKENGRKRRPLFPPFRLPFSPFSCLSSLFFHFSYE